jgi:hypothetical protein
MHHRFPFLFLIILSLLFVSCEADINLHNVSDEVSLHPDLIVPIGWGSISLRQIIALDDSLNFVQRSYYEYHDSISNISGSIANALNEYTDNDITSTILVFNITNGLPEKIKFMFDLKDSLGNRIPTTLEESYIINAGQTDAAGIVQPGKESKQTILVTITKDQLVNLKKANSMTYTVRIDGGTVESNLKNTFDLKVGLFVEGDIEKTL